MYTANIYLFALLFVTWSDSKSWVGSRNRRDISQLQIYLTGVCWGHNQSRIIISYTTSLALASVPVTLR
jgi:hypothetical protein